MIKKNLFFYQTKRDRRWRWWWKMLVWMLILALFIWGLIIIIKPLNPQGTSIFWANLVDLGTFNNLDPNFPSISLIKLAGQMLLKTINYTILGTSLGFGIGYLLTFLTSKNFMPRWISYLAKSLLLFARSFPILVIIYTFQSGLIKESAITTILAWTTLLWTNKYLSDIFENENPQLYHALLAKGIFRFSAFKKGIIIKNQNKVLMIFLYALESNLRWSTILGTLGIMGIGYLISSNIPNHFENIGIPLIFLLLTIILLELVLFVFNNYILNYQSPKNRNQTKNWLILNQRKIIKIFFLLVLIIWNITLLFTFNWDFTNLGDSLTFFSYAFEANLSSWTSNAFSINPWLMMIELFLQVLITMIFSILGAFVLAIFASEKTSNKISAWVVKIILIFIRIIPAFVLLFIFDPLFMDSRTTAFLIFTISQITLLTKQFGESINAISQQEINLLRAKGYSLTKINVSFIFPRIKEDVITYSLFATENLLRSYIFYGIFSANLIGNKISILHDRARYQEMFAYVWPIVITLISFNIIIKLKERRHYLNNFKFKWWVKFKTYLKNKIVMMKKFLRKI